MLRRLSIFAIVVAASACSGCSEKECQFATDCDPGKVCIAKKCADAPGPTPRIPEDGGPPRDALPAGDATTPDAAPDASTGDAGTSTSGDAGMAGGNVNLGEIWVYETIIADSKTEIRAIAGFHNFPALPTTSTFTEGAVSCLLTDARAILERELAYNGVGVNITGFNGVLLPNNMIHLDPVQPGHFDSGRVSAVFIFRDPGATLTYTVQPGSSTADLGGASGTSRAATSLAVLSPQISQTIDLRLPSPSFSWMPRADVTPGRTIVVELADQYREVILRCATSDSGSMSIPTSARQAFLALPLTAPVSLELRHEEVGTMSVPVVGTSVTIPTELRATAGIRYRTAF